MKRVRGRKYDGRVCRRESGFTLAELLAAVTVLLIFAASAFGVLADIQRTAAFQSEIQQVLENTRMALETATRYLRHCGNDPHASRFDALEIIDHATVRLRSDVTGSRGPADPDKGDPDGDTSDATEDVTLSYNAGAQTLEVAAPGGGAQVVATNISAFSLEYRDSAGAPTNAGGAVHVVRVNLTGKSGLRDPRTRQYFSLALASDVQIAARQ